MRIAYITLGCKLNYAETSTYERGFLSHGLETVQWEEGADIYLVNTCSVTGHSEKKARNIIRKLHRVNPSALIVVTGCYAELRPGEIEGLEGVVRVFRAGEKSSVVSGTMAIIESRAPIGADSVQDTAGSDEAMLPAWSSGERTRSFLKVQDGCNNFCAYCTVPYARGRSRNVPISTLVGQAREIAARGYREIVLTGVNTGDFGRTTGESFLELLQALEGVEGIERYRISSIEPNLLSDEVIDWTASSSKFLPHFHIPLQTGCDELLSSMGRKYSTAHFAGRTERIRSSFASAGKSPVFFGIDVIAGLPGETDGMFRQTYDFLAETVRPAFIHIFPYSKRSGTRAALMPCQVQEKVKTERVEALEALCAELHREFLVSNRGRVEKVLWESVGDNGLISGYTGNYIRVEAPLADHLPGTVEDVLLEGDVTDGTFLLR